MNKASKIVIFFTVFMILCGMLTIAYASTCSVNGIMPGHENNLTYGYTGKNDKTHNIAMRCSLCKSAWTEVDVPHEYTDGICKCGYKAKATGILLDKQEVTMYVGEKLNLVATALPEGANPRIQWKSSKTNVAGVNKGEITAKKKGTSIITAKVTNDITATCIINVIDKPEVEKTISLTQTQLTMKPGEIIELTAVVTPAEYLKNVKWVSSASAIASVSKGTVKAKKVGTATITAQVSETATATCIINVVPGAPTKCSNDNLLEGHESKLTYTYKNKKGDTHDLTVRCVTCKSSWSVKGVPHVFVEGVCECKTKLEPKQIVLSQTEAILQVGETLKITASALPAESNPVINWSSSKMNVAEVEDGIIIAKKAGKARIIAKVSNGVKAICQVTVVEKPKVQKTLALDKTEITMKVDEELQINAIVTPVEYTKDVKWTSDRTTIATVSKGLIKAKKPGQVTIKAELDNMKVNCIINVMPKDS